MHFRVGKRRILDMIFTVAGGVVSQQQQESDDDDDNYQPSAAKQARLADLNNPNWYTKLAPEVRQKIMFPDGKDPKQDEVELRQPQIQQQQTIHHIQQTATVASTTSVGQIYLTPDVQVKKEFFSYLFYHVLLFQRPTFFSTYSRSI